MIRKKKMGNLFFDGIDDEKNIPAESVEEVKLNCLYIGSKKKIYSHKVFKYVGFSSFLFFFLLNHPTIHFISKQQQTVFPSKLKSQVIFSKSLFSRETKTESIQTEDKGKCRVAFFVKKHLFWESKRGKKRKFHY